MPYIQIWVKPEVIQILDRIATIRGVSIEQVAADAVESEAVSHLPGGIAGGGMHIGSRGRQTLTCGGVGVAEFEDLSDLRFVISP